jgi:hypothetical protein
VLKSGIWPKFHGKMGMKIGVNSTGTKLSFFWRQINQIWIKNASKTTYSYSARRDLSIGAWFDHSWRKIILVNFCGKGPPFGLKIQKKFLFKKGHITHQSKDFVLLSKNMWLLRCFSFIFEWLMSKSVILGSWKV